MIWQDIQIIKLKTYNNQYIFVSISDVKETVKQLLIKPICRKKLQETKEQTPRGVLLYGLPGTGTVKSKYILYLNIKHLNTRTNKNLLSY